MSSCERCGKPIKNGGSCAECVAEFAAGLERARQIWEYSEPRILAYDGSDWRTVRQEGYNFLLFNLLWCTRRSKWDRGQRIRTNVGERDFQSLAEAITTSRSTINNNRFLYKRLLYLQDAGYVKILPDGIELGEYDPHISI